MSLLPLTLHWLMIMAIPFSQTEKWKYPSSTGKITKGLNNLGIYYIDSNAKAEKMESKIENNCITFETDHSVLTL